MKRLVIAPRAAADLDDILLYIARDNPEAALGLLRRLEGSSRILAERPGLGRRRPELGAGVRVHPVGAYLIVYRAERDRVVVVRYLHGARRIGPTVS